jgi:hypothetical protein
MNNTTQLILKGETLYIIFRVIRTKTANLASAKSTETCGGMFHQLLSFTTGCCEMYLNAGHQSKQLL